MKIIRNILYYSIIAIATIICITAAILSDIYDGVVEFAKRNKQ